VAIHRTDSPQLTLGGKLGWSRSALTIDGNSLPAGNAITALAQSLHRQHDGSTAGRDLHTKAADLLLARGWPALVSDVG
jgi:hypothetical protein